MIPTTPKLCLRNSTMCIMSRVHCPSTLRDSLTEKLRRVGRPKAAVNHVTQNEPSNTLGANTYLPHGIYHASCVRASKDCRTLTCQTCLIFRPACRNRRTVSPNCPMRAGGNPEKHTRSHYKPPLSSQTQIEDKGRINSSLFFKPLGKVNLIFTS